MAKQTINLGSSANDGTGDPLRTAFDKINDNFDELSRRMEEGIVQDWRRCNLHSAVYDDRATVAAGVEKPGTKADIWSLGCLLVEVITGRKFFQSVHFTKVFQCELIRREMRRSRFQPFF